jgi:serine/threonine-protein kinase RsbW
MKDSARLGCDLRRPVPANLQAVEEFIEAFRQRTTLLLDPADSFTAELLLREALTNAVVHGCHTQQGKQVRCSVRLNGRRMLAVIADDGDGFDWRAPRCVSRTFASCSGRGIEILRKYATHVRYNDRGNVAAILKRF